MDTTNYFDLLTQECPDFVNVTTHATAGDMENPELKALAKATYNSLRIHREQLVQSKAKFSELNSVLKKERTAQFIKTAKQKAEEGIETFFRPIEQAAATAAEGYGNAQKVPEPENSVTYLRQQEVRSRLATLPLSERIATIQDQTAAGNLAIFEAVCNDPLPAKGFLGTPGEGILSGFAQAYAEKKYPEYCQRARESEHLLKQATLLKNIAISAGLRQNEARFLS